MFKILYRALVPPAHREIKRHGARLALALGFGLLASGALRAFETSKLEVRITAGEAPCAARVHLRGPDGEPVLVSGHPAWRDHFVCRGGFEASLPAGEYHLEIERGPEWKPRRDRPVLAAGETLRRDYALERRLSMREEGYWSGDTHVHRSPAEMPLHLEAEDLHHAPVLTIWNQRNAWSRQPLPASLTVQVAGGRTAHLLSLEDERNGGALLYHRLREPFSLGRQGQEFPPPLVNHAAITAQPGVVTEIEKPFWWDAPTWVALGAGQVIGIANNHQCRSTMLDSEAWGFPRPRDRFPSPRGNGFFSQALYYRLLNCGFRLPPTAGSASGVLPNPVGYNRVYVHLEEPFTPERWWRGLLAGRSFVTNGPLLRVTVNGERPGEIFRGASAVELEIRGRVDSNDPLESVELIRGGEIARREIFSREREAVHEHAFTWKVTVERSDWLLVRTIARVPRTFRFASTAPFHVELEGRPSTIRKRDVRFFLEWIDRRLENLRRGDREKLEGERLESVLAPHLEARRRFEALLASPGAR